MHALVLTYGVKDVFQTAHDELCHELAPSFARVPGLIAATWLANRTTGRFGVFFVFDAKASFDRFVSSELFGTLWFSGGIDNVSASDFSVSAGPTAVTRGPATSRAAA